MGIVLGLAASLAALVFAVWPLLRHSSTERFRRGETGELLSRRDIALNDIRDVDFDRDLGNLSEEDHRLLREKYKRNAVGILKQLNARESRLDEEIEEAVAALRGTPLGE